MDTRKPVKARKEARLLVTLTGEVVKIVEQRKREMMLQEDSVLKVPRNVDVVSGLIRAGFKALNGRQEEKK